MAGKYFMLEPKEQETNITIYGDITSWEWMESDVSSYSLAKAIEGIITPVINVYINSYGGEVAEGVAIYRQLKRHAAQVRTYCDGFACSAASVVFMAGDERIVYPTSMLMVHNALFDNVSGNAAELRKRADIIEAISQTAANAYMDAVTIDRETLDTLLANETWIPPQMALDMGFATQIAAETAPDAKATLSARQSVFKMICGAQQAPKNIVGSSDVAPAASNQTPGSIKGQPCATSSWRMAEDGKTFEFVIQGLPYVPTMGHVPPQKPPENQLFKSLKAAINKELSRQAQ